MPEADLRAIFESLREQLEKDEAEGRLAGVTVADLKEAIAHPLAPAIVGESMAAEASSVQPGEPAADFTLPWLPGTAPDESPTFTLSSRFGRRPVALIFGSYT